MLGTCGFYGFYGFLLGFLMVRWFGSVASLTALRGMGGSIQGGSVAMKPYSYFSSTCRAGSNGTTPSPKSVPIGTVRLS
jgi:hypothetical protein